MRGSHDQETGEPNAIAAAPTASAGPLGVGLKRRAEFVAAGRGRRVHARSMTLQIARRTDESIVGPRFGLTVTKKVGCAVERNRIKRRLRVVLRAPGLAPQAGHDYVIVARREALTLPFDALVTDLNRLIEQAQNGRHQPRGERKSPDGRAPGSFGRGKGREASDRPKVP